MGLRWGEEKVKGFADKVTTAERSSWLGDLIDKYFSWVIVVTCVVTIIWLWVKIYQLWRIHTWLMSF